MQERRTSARVRSFLGGKIVFNNRCSSVECLVRNVSPTGARILLSETVTIPEDFELEIPKQGRSVRARLAWRKAGECGVRFLPCEAERDSVPVNVVVKFEQLEHEKAALSARVSQLGSAQ